MIVRYNFTTKDKVRYDVTLAIKNDGTARIDFLTNGPQPMFFSLIELINMHDAIKVFNTLRLIILQHKDKIKKLTIHSTAERNEFYKKLLNYLGIKYEQTGPTVIITQL